MYFTISQDKTTDSENTDVGPIINSQLVQSSSSIDEDIESIKDLEGFKIVLKKLNDKLKMLENVVEQLKDSNSSKHVENEVILPFEKISSIEGFDVFIGKIKDSAEYRQSIVSCLM